MYIIQIIILISSSCTSVRYRGFSLHFSSQWKQNGGLYLKTSKHGHHWSIMGSEDGTKDTDMGHLKLPGVPL